MNRHILSPQRAPGGVISGAQMRATEERAIAAGVVDGPGLMERAGAEVVGRLLLRRPGLAMGARRALVLCGPGANGGDGYVVARLLAQRGWRIDVHALGSAPAAGSDAALALDRWRASGPVRPWSALAGAGSADVLVDAVFGLGLSRATPETFACALAARERLRAFTVAVDGPSGLCLDTGRALGAVLPADLTVTFHRAKPGHVIDRGPMLCGVLEVADIGLEPFAAKAEEAALVGAPLVDLRKARDAHKFGHGHVVVVAGGSGRGGAARLAARAALRVGAGLVTVAAPPEAMPEHAARLDAVMLRPVADGAALAAALRDARASAVAIGPGLGLDARAEGLLDAALASGLPLALDADALTLLAANPRPIPSCAALTPHLGEFRRLAPREAADWAPDGKAAAVRRLAAVMGATTLLKGPDTLVAAPDGRLAVHCATGQRAAPWLATAGSGDVLTGLLAGLLARGAPPFEAAATAAWLHVEAALRFGPGLIAEDLPEALPAVLAAALAAPTRAGGS